jgi:hypothetical protein
MLDCGVTGVTGGTFYSMRGHAYCTGSPVPLAVTLILCALCSAEAGDVSYCVTCKGPDQTYLCRVTGDDVSQSDAVKLYCVVRTAKEGGHAACAARDATASCNGVEKTYSYKGPSIPEGLAGDPRVKKRMEKDQKAFQQDDKRKSLVEVTGQALSASRRGWRNIRASLGGREEANQSSVPSSAEPSGSAAPLPELPSQTTPTIPLSAASQSTVSPERKRGVGSFARNTYRCVRAFFRHCRSDAEAQSQH